MSPEAFAKETILFKILFQKSTQLNAQWTALERRINAEAELLDGVIGLLRRIVLEEIRGKVTMRLIGTLEQMSQLSVTTEGKLMCAQSITIAANTMEFAIGQAASVVSLN